MESFINRATRRGIVIYRSIGVMLVALGVTACVGPQERIPDPACEHCYRTESGIPYKTWEAYDP